MLFEHWGSLAGQDLTDSMLLFAMSAGYLAANPDMLADSALAAA